LVKTVPNGKLFVVKNDVQPNLKIAHVWGTAYQMGYAHGQLIGDDVRDLIKSAYAYFEQQLEKYIKDLPEFLVKLIVDYGMAAALEATYYMTRSYTPEHFHEELQGMADATGLSFMQLAEINMFPELIQAACTMFGSWGPAIRNSNGTLYQLRALDWSMDGPFQQWPLVIVYHPSDRSNFNFAALTFPGFVGLITGFSSASVGISQKVWGGFNGTMSRFGYPWHYVLRDILQFDTDITAAENRMINAARTCAIFVGVGDNTLNQFRAFGYSYDRLNVWDDKTYPLYPNHPHMQGLVWIDKHNQPSNDPCMTQLIQKYYGSLTAETTIKYITSVFQTGDTHIALYDYSKLLMYVSVAAPVSAGGTPAYDRRFTCLDLGKAFKEPPPKV